MDKITLKYKSDLYILISWSTFQLRLNSARITIYYVSIVLFQ